MFFGFGLKARKAGSVVLPALCAIGLLLGVSFVPDPRSPLGSIHTAKQNFEDRRYYVLRRERKRR
jgi:hypothetical protein